MDEYLRTMNPIVPLAKVEKIDARTREREFARGEFLPIKPTADH